MNICTAIKCIRLSRDTKNIVGFSIERTCRRKELDCPKHLQSKEFKIINKKNG